MEPVEVAKSLILGKFAKPLAERLYGGTSIDKIEIYLARDLRIVNHEAQQRFVAVIGPGMGIDPSASNVFGVLTPTIDDVLNYTFKSGYALQVGFNYGKVGGGWRRGAKALYSSELYALEKIIVEVEGKDESALGEAKAVAKRLVDSLLSYVDDVYVEYSGHKSYYLGLWLPEPITGIKAGVNISLGDLYRGLGLRLVKGLGKRERNLIDRQYINAVKLLRVPGYLHEATGKPAQYLDIDLKTAEFDPGIMDRAVLTRGFITSVVSSMIIAAEDKRPRRPRRVELNKVEEWSIIIKFMLEEGVRLNDGRIRFSYVLGNWCAAKRLGLDKCREIHSRLVEGSNTREYQRYLEYGFNHPEYLPWPYVFFRGHEWYSVTDVDVFQDVYEALRGRIRRHIEPKSAPQPQVSSAKLNSTEGNTKATEARVEANTPNSNTSTDEADAKAEAGLVGHSSEGKAKPDAAETAGSSTGGAKAPVVEVNTHPNANNPPSEDASTTPEAKAWVVKAPEAKSTHNAEAVVNSHNPSVVGAESSEPKTKTEAKANQGSQAEPSVVEGLAMGVHWSGGMARINIGAYINHNDSPVEAIAIRKSTVGTEVVEAPVRLATVDAVARGLCKTEECLISVRLAVIFTLNAVRSGPVRLRWLEGEFESRHPTHYETLRKSGVTMLDIAAALKGLGVATIGDIVAPGGWHPRWLAGLVKGILEAKGGVTASGLMGLVRKHDRDLPSEFEGGLTLSDLIALTVRFLEWLGVVRVEGGVITLVK